MGFIARLHSFHMPLFFWISGFVFYFSSIEVPKKINLLKKITSKIKKLLIPMYATSFLVLLPTIYFFGHINGSILTQSKYFIIGSNNDHLWFLKTLFSIFIIVIPAYHYRIDNIFFYLSFLIIWVTLSYSKEYLPIITLMPLTYFPFFMVGILSRKYEKYLLNRNIILYFTIFFIFHLILILNKSKSTNSIGDLSYYPVAFVGIYFMYYFSNILSDYFVSKNIWGIIHKIDDASYSIYLFHITFLYLVLYLDHKFQINIPTMRVSISFFTGITMSYLLFILSSKNKAFSYLFGVKYNTKPQVIPKFFLKRR